MNFIISPHIDDAVLSLGGIIKNMTDSQQALTVVNIFTISAWVNQESTQVLNGIHYEKDEKLISELRKQEERDVAERLKYTTLFWDLLDKPLRENEDDAAHWVTLIEMKLKALCNHEDDFFFPIGFGHPDHMIVRDVGIRLFNEGFKVLFYEDMPYATFGDYDYENQYTSLSVQGLIPVYEQINIEAKIQILQLYQTQVSNDWLKGIKNYAYNICENAFYERYWKPT